MSADEHILELLPGYVLNCLDEAELILVSEHLAACPACQTELQAYQAVADQLALAVPQAAPSPHLKRQLMEHIQPAKPQAAWWQPLTGFMQRTTPVWGLASLFLIVILAASTLLLWQRVNQLESLTQSNGLRTIPLAATEAAPTASGLIVLSLDGWHGTLVVDHLPPLDPKHDYQLWLIQDEQRASGAVFSVNKDGYGSVWVSSPEPLASYSDFGVSIEPTGGSAGPTGDKVLGGSTH